MVFSALNVNFRDNKHAAGVCDSNRNLQYSCDLHDPRCSFALPMVGGTHLWGGSGFSEECLLGNHAWWKLIGISLSVSLVLFGCGLFIFQYMERRFAGIV